MDQTRADTIKNLLYLDSLYFLHSREFSILILQKILVSFTTILMLILFFFFRKISRSLMSIFGAFCFFLLQKDFGTIQEPLLIFFFYFLIIVTCHFYTQKKLKKIFFNFLHQNLLHQNIFHQNFLHQNFLYQNVVNNIFRHLFSLTTYLHPSKNT